MIRHLRDFLLNKQTLLVLYIMIAVLAFIQIQGGRYNNWLIFRQSYFHLVNGLPLYVQYPSEYSDYFFYNPVFIFIVAPFTVFPVKIGLALWILSTSLITFYAIRQLPVSEKKQNIFALLIIFDLLNNLQYPQSNPLLLAFMLLTWAMMEKKKFVLAALFIVLCFCIKGYGGIIGLLVFYNRNWWKMILYCVGWLVLLHLPLLLFLSPAHLAEQYTAWIRIISGDIIKERFSLYGVAGLISNSIREAYILIAAFLSLAVFLFFHRKNSSDRLMTLTAFLLILIVVFNRAAESPTYLFSIAGCILWFLARDRSKFFSVLFWITIIVASIFPTDVIPLFDKIRYDYYLKAILCFFVLLDMILFQARLYPRYNHPSKKLRYEI